MLHTDNVNRDIFANIAGFSLSICFKIAIAQAICAPTTKVVYNE